MSIQMPFDLALGFHHKPQVPFVAQATRDRAHCKGTRVPKRVGKTGTATEFANTRLAPGQMCAFLLSRSEHLRTYALATRSERLTVIQRLRGDFASMVHPHQRRSMRALRRAQLRLGHATCRTGGCSRGRREHGA